MAKFYPPSQLPPMGSKKIDITAQSSPPPPITQKRVVFYLLIFLVLGSIVAFIGFYFTGSIAFLAVIPVALALGWYIAKNPSDSVSPANNPPDKGPVLW